METAVDPDSTAHADSRMAVPLRKLAVAVVAAGVAREAEALPAAHHGGTALCPLLRDDVLGGSPLRAVLAAEKTRRE